MGYGRRDRSVLTRVTFGGSRRDRRSGQQDVGRFCRCIRYSGEGKRPLAATQVPHKTKIVTAKILDMPSGPAPFYRIVKVHCPCMEVLQKAAGSPDA